MAKSPDVHDRLDDDDVLRDGETQRVPMMLRDGSTVDLEDWQRDWVYASRLGLDDALALHKPGPRYLTDQAGLDAKARAYEEGVREMCDAWRKPAADANSETGIGSGEFRGAQEGDACTVREGGVGEGSPGHLRMVNGKLTCVPDARRADAVPRTMTADAAQRIRDAAWLELVKELEQAWKR